MRNGLSQIAFVVGAVQVDVALEGIAARAAIVACFQTFEAKDAGKDQVLVTRIPIPQADWLAGRKAHS